MELKGQCIVQTLNLLSAQGLKFTMSDLATELHVSKKTLYKIFDSKEAMLMAVAEECFAVIKAEEKEILAMEGLSFEERIRKLIIVIPEQYKNLNWYLMEEVALKYPKVYQYIKGRMESDWEPTLQLLEEGRQAGVFREVDPVIFKSMVEGCMEHFLTSSQLKERHISYTEALNEMMNILLRGIVKEDKKHEI